MKEVGGWGVGDLLSNVKPTSPDLFSQASLGNSFVFQPSPSSLPAFQRGLAHGEIRIGVRWFSRRGHGPDPGGPRPVA